MGESTLWNDWYGKASKDAINHCHILFTINTVGAENVGRVVFARQMKDRNILGSDCLSYT
jgi:hypothetical protein